MTRPLTPAELTEIGRALWGPVWQTPMSVALELSGTARIRQWLTGQHDVPPGVRVELVGMLSERSTEAKLLAARLMKQSTTNHD